MIAFTWIAQAFSGLVSIFNTPISYLGGLSLINIGIALCCVAMVNRFLLMPMFSRHKQDSATERKKK